MDGFPGLPHGMMPPMGAAGMMMPPGLMSMGDMAFSAPGADLRQMPEGQQMLETMGRGSRSGNDRHSPPPGKRRRGSTGGIRGGPGGMGVMQPPPERAGVKSTAFKSRLCTRFMQKGDCSYGATCHFAHGYDDLQTPDKAGPGGPPMGMMMPGGRMMPPDMMAMAAMGGLPGPSGMLPARPRPPPGPPPGAPPADYPASQQFSPDCQGYTFDMSRTPTRVPSEVPYISRVKAACMLMKIGNVRPREVGNDAIEATMAAMQTGEAFEGNAYSDTLSMYAH